MRVLLVEPYAGGSHQAWAEGYRAASSHDVRLITHEARFWKWRMQGGHISLAHLARRHVEVHGVPDVVLASSMLHLSAFLGATRRSLGAAPAALYMHENQLGYPPSPRDRHDETYAMINWSSMAAADHVFFNSRFHLDSWFRGLEALLGRFPDHRHVGFVPAVRARSSVLAVGVDLARIDQAVPADVGGAPVVLWNHRWEHDKDPAAFASAVAALAETGRDFRVVVTGEKFVSPPAEFEVLPAVLGDRLAHLGHVDDGRYVQLLAAADIVVSTSTQEFFGVAVTEAVYAGAFPLLPRRLVYPERIPQEFHDRCLYENADDLVAKLAWAVDHPSESAAVAGELRPVMAGFDWSAMAPRYDAALADLAASSW